VRVRVREKEWRKEIGMRNRAKGEEGDEDFRGNLAEKGERGQ